MNHSQRIFGLAIKARLGDPVDQIAGMLLQQSENGFKHLLVADDRFWELRLDVLQKVGPAKSSTHSGLWKGQNSRYDC